MQRLHYPKQIKVDNLKNIRRECSSHFRKERRNIAKQGSMNLKLTGQ